MNFIKSSLIEEQKRMLNKSQYEKEIIEMVGDAGVIEKGQEIKYAPIVVDSMKEIQKLDVEKVFNNPKFKEVIIYFENRINRGLSLIGLNVIAELNDSSSFISEMLPMSRKAGAKSCKKINIKYSYS